MLENHSRLPQRTVSSPGGYRQRQIDMSCPVHLISSDLWEAITGEHLTPSSICQTLSYSFGPDPQRPVPNFQSAQYVAMAKDRVGSRSLQTKLDGGPAEVAAIFDAIYPCLAELVPDQAANFVIQKLCEVITPEQQQQVLAFFLANIDTVIEQPNGCRVLQKFIESTSHNNIAQIFDAVHPKLLPLCHSPNGNHIVQRFIESLPEKLNDIVETVRPHLVQLAVDNCGCRVVQKLFDKYDVGLLSPLVTEVLRAADELAVNQYGNYVVQHILEARKREHVSALVQAFRGRFYEFSIHKFASNVIEKCIRGASVAERATIITEIIGEEGDWQDERISKMAGDQFGNYVMQRIIEFGTKAQQDAIYEAVYDDFDHLIEINYAKHVIARLEDLGFDFGIE